MSGRNGIAVAGTILVDKINEIAAYPGAGELTKILGVQTAAGGNVPNVGIDLKKIDPALPVYAMGLIGKDDNGAYLKNLLKKEGLELSALKETDAPTSFTQVMSIPGGQRTFFTYAGADAELTAAHIDWERFPAKMLHLAYFLLLKKVDEGEGLKILKEASARGIETSIDLVSENSDRYGLVRPCLPHTDYLIVNELEAGKLAEMDPTPENLSAIAQKLLEMGVRKKVIIHLPAMSLCASANGLTTVPSLELPEDWIKGTTGAGDAFCAGALYGIYQGRSDLEILEFASCAAAMALSTADATSGLKTEGEIFKMFDHFKRKPL